MSMNMTTVVGTVQRDPSAPPQTDGTKVTARFGMLVRTSARSGTVTHFEVRCQHGLAENVLASVREGDEVIVAGHLEQRTWNGSSRTVLLASEVGLALSFHRINAPEDDEGDPE